MRENLRPGEKFPDTELPNQDGVLSKLSTRKKFERILPNPANDALAVETAND